MSHPHYRLVTARASDGRMLSLLVGPLHRNDVVTFPPELPHTVAASAIVGLLAYARVCGIATDGVLEAAGLRAASLDGPEARVPHAANNIVWSVLADRSRDDHFGLHFAERMTVDAFDVVGHLLARSKTFGEGLARVVAYSRILHDAGRVETELRGKHVVVYPGCRGLTHEFPRQVAEFSAASVVVLGRVITGTHVRAAAVRFRHAKAKSVAEHTRIFGVEPTFDATETEVVLDAKVLALAIPDAQPGVLTYLDAYARDVIAKLPVDDDFVARVETTVAKSMDRGLPEMGDVATQLGMSPRTLQRRLADAETSFHSLVDAVRRRYAERYLDDDRLSVAEIAFLVGFSEPSNFHRAFRRWTGVTPTAFRDARRAAG